MKRIVQLALALALALALMLPAAAIINTDGTDPDWDGYEGIRPMSDVVVLNDAEDLDDYSAYELDAIADYDSGFGFDDPEWDRHPLARDGEGYADIEPIAIGIEPISADNTMMNTIVLWAALGMAALALLLAIIALAKAGRKKPARIKNDFF
ncbi:MAG: hypothetical protein FWB76_01010 [Oscillospiraceae bacterium]|nr:hypothetical protein [Oscillospiraceae bacterium]